MVNVMLRSEWLVLRQGHCTFNAVDEDIDRAVLVYVEQLSTSIF